jgi:hypothetical protein
VPLLREVVNLGHKAACHLTAEDRTRLWAELSTGHVPPEAEIPAETAFAPGTGEPVSRSGAEA